MCAIEAVHYFKTEKNCLIIINRGTDNNFNQIKTLLNLYNGNFDIVIDLKGSDKKLSGWMNKFDKIHELTEENKIENIFIGDYRDGLSRHLSNCLSNSNTFLLDDGFATILIQNELKSGKNYNTKDFIKLLISRFRYSYEYRKDVNFFTIFDEHIVGSIGHSFEYLKQESNPHLLEDTLYFLGSPVVEDDIMTKEKYIEIVTDYLKRCNLSKIYYLPHRRENAEKIELISDITDSEVLKIDLPIEIYLLKNNIEPDSIASLFSTALFTLSKLLKKSKIDVIRVDPTDLNKRREHIGNIYSILEEI